MHDNLSFGRTIYKKMFQLWRKMGGGVSVNINQLVLQDNDSKIKNVNEILEVMVRVLM